jgi:hypothetical protein
LLQVPGIFVSEWLAAVWAICSGWFQWGIAFCVQALVWSIAGFVFLVWQRRKTPVPTA